MASTPVVRVPDTGPAPFRIRTTGPSVAPLVVKATGRGSVPPLRIGRFLIASGDRIALHHLLERHVPARGLRQRLERWAALATLDRGMEGVALSVLHRRYGAQAPGALEVEAVWAAVRDTLKCCGLTGVRIRLHQLSDPARGLDRGGVLIGFSRRGQAAEPTHALVVLKVRMMGSGRPRFAHEAQALASVRAPLTRALKALVPAPLAHRVSDGVEVLATGFVPGRPLPLDLSPGRRSSRLARRHLVATAGALAELQARLGPGEDGFVDGSAWPEEADAYAWSGGLRERLAVQPLPMLPAHGDLTPANVLFDGGHVSGIIDWSRHRDADLPTRDLFRFLLGYGRLLDPRPSRERASVIRRAFVERNPVSQAVRQALLRYGTSLGLDLPMLEGLFRLHLVAGGGAEDPCHPLGTAAARAAALRVMDGATETVFTP